MSGRTCAIVGGVLTIATIFDSVLFATGKRLKKGGLSGGNGYGGFGEAHVITLYLYVIYHCFFSRLASFCCLFYRKEITITHSS